MIFNELNNVSVKFVNSVLNYVPYFFTTKFIIIIHIILYDFFSFLFIDICLWSMKNDLIRAMFYLYFSVYTKIYMLYNFF